MAVKAKTDTVLVVSGDSFDLDIVTSGLSRCNYRCLAAGGEDEALALLDGHDIALAFAEVNIHCRSAFHIIEAILSESPDTMVVMILDSGDACIASQGFKAGAYDYVTRPLDMDNVAQSARRALETRRLELENRDYKETLETRVAERTREINEALVRIKTASIDTITRLARAAESRDEDTGNHIQRMSRYTAFIAEKMGLPDEYVETILSAATMHDIGKIGIPDSILLKPGKLTEEEWAIMKQHTVIGARILDGAEAEVIKLGAAIAISHHEKWDGSGYPFGFKGENIPLSGRIAAVADVFDSVTSKRVYRTRDFTPVEAFRLIEQGVAQHFDPAVFAAFKAAWRDILDEHERSSRQEEFSLQSLLEAGA